MCLTVADLGTNIWATCLTIADLGTGTIKVKTEWNVKLLILNRMRILSLRTQLRPRISNSDRLSNSGECVLILSHHCRDFYKANQQTLPTA